MTADQSFECTYSKRISEWTYERANGPSEKLGKAIIYNSLNLSF